MEIDILEEWRTCITSPFYEISTLGRFRSLERKVLSSHGAFRTMHGKLLSVSKATEKDYAIISFGNNINRSLHRELALVFIPNPLNLPEVNHIDGDKRHNWLNNLEWSTESHNVLHALNMGLVASGENDSSSKLTNKEVEEIRSKYIPRKYSQYKLAREYNVHQSTIHLIISNKSRKRG